MIYLSKVWLDNKVTIVIADDASDHRLEIEKLEKLGGKILSTTVQDNELDQVITVRTVRGQS